MFLYFMKIENQSCLLLSEELGSYENDLYLFFQFNIWNMFLFSFVK